MESVTQLGPFGDFLYLSFLPFLYVGLILSLPSCVQIATSTYNVRITIKIIPANTSTPGIHWFALDHVPNTVTKAGVIM